MKKTIKILSIITFVAIVATSCGGGKSNKQAAEEKKKKVKEFVEREFEYPMPTSFEVTKMLSAANSGYNSSVMNDPKKVDSYVSTWQKATNLGVYGADLSYAATFEEKQKTIDYLEVAEKLINDLNISSAFNRATAERVENNLENIDSLIYIVSESLYDTYDYLNKNGEEKTSILVVAGSVIEGLHITCELIKNSENKNELMKVLATQKLQVSKLIDLMSKYPDDEDIKKVIPDLKYIKLVYDQLGDNEKITEGQFLDIMNSVKEMRQHIVG